MLLLLLGQIFYLNISSVKIPLPAFVIDKIFNDYLTITPSISIRIHDTYLSGFSNIQISKIEFAQENKVFAKIEGLEIDLNPRFFALNNEAAFREIQISKIIIDFKSKSQELFLGRNLKLLGGKEASYQVSGSFALGQHEIKILGKLNLPVEFSKSSGSRFRVEDFLELAEQKTEIDRFRQEQVKTRKELRAVQLDLRRNIERLGTVLTFINTALVPLLIIIIAIAASIMSNRARSRA